MKFPMNIYTPSTGLLDNQCLHKLASRAARVSSEDDIGGILGLSYGWEFSLFKSYGMLQWSTISQLLTLSLASKFVDLCIQLSAQITHEVQQ